MPDRSPAPRQVVLVAVAVAALSGCGGDSAAAPPAAPESPAATITIANFKFSPAELQVTAGQKITVVNEDSAAHTATAQDRSFDSQDLAQGKTYVFTAGKAGTISYICDIHQYMKGRIVVS